MSSDDIISNLEKKAEEQITSLRKDSQATVDAISKEKEEKLATIKATWDRKIAETLESMEKTGKDESMMLYRNIIMEKKSSIIREAWEKIETLADQIRKSSSYRELVSNSVKTAVKSLGSGCTIYGSEKDREIIAASGKGFTYSPDNTILGGIKASSKDGKLTLDMTITGILNERKDLFEEMLMGSKGA